MPEIKIDFNSRDFRAIIGYCFKKKMSAKDTAEEIDSVLGPNTVSYELVKEHLRGRRFSSEEIDRAVNDFFNSITHGEWRRVYNKWQERMKRVIGARGNYL